MCIRVFRDLIVWIRESAECRYLAGCCNALFNYTHGMIPAPVQAPVFR